MIKGKNFTENAKCKHGNRSVMSNSAWCGLNGKGDILKLHDKCPKHKCNCQNKITFTTNQFQLDGGSINSQLQNFFKRTQAAWNKFLKPTIITLAPVVGMTVSSKMRNPKVGQATTNNLESTNDGKTLSVTDMHGKGL